MVRIGEKLRDERVKKGLTLDAVSKITKIKSTFLASIEKGDYNKLPSSAYIQGFVKNYIEFLELPKKECLALFRREYNEREYINVLPESFTKQEAIPLRRFRLGQITYYIAGFFIILIGYLIFQYRYTFINPYLEVTQPKENQVVNRTFHVLGSTDPNATVFINDELAALDNFGNFDKTITLFTGKTTIKIRVQNRFNKQTQLDRHIEVR